MKSREISIEIPPAFHTASDKSPGEISLGTRLISGGHTLFEDFAETRDVVLL